MKLILDLDDNVVENMQGYCEQGNIDINYLVEKLFNTYIQYPAEMIDELANNNELDEFYTFVGLVQVYLNRAIQDIEESANSDEAYDENGSVAHAFKILSRDYINSSHITTGMYKAFKEGNEEVWKCVKSLKNMI